MKTWQKELIKMFSIILGVLFIIFGIVGLFTPLIPGTLIILAGLVLLGFHPIYYLIKNRKKKN
ncbi:MAG: hypothetical protein NT076_05400 [Candidatus Pacearchaeota archaeon]|nr:hypothetical protein [Candidatus Pacearchaeota archaeon]